MISININQMFWKKEIIKNPFDWFAEYQNLMTWEEWVELYWKLIEEEQDEFIDALKNKDLIEVYDAVADILFVSAWEQYFVTRWKFEIDFEEFIRTEYWIDMFNRDCVLECLEEVTRSNFTKSKQLAKDWEKIWKVIKWENYSAPNLLPILKKYNIM